MLVPVGVSVVPAAADGHHGPVPLLPRAALPQDPPGAGHHDRPRRCAGRRLVLDAAATGLVVACAYLLTAPLGVLTAPLRARVFGAQAVAPRAAGCSRCSCRITGRGRRPRRLAVLIAVGRRSQRRRGERPAGPGYSGSDARAADPGDLTGLDASAALNRTVDALTAEELAAPSLLPGWTRAHVVAHLALNGAGAGPAFWTRCYGASRSAMYESDEQRDARHRRDSGHGPDVAARPAAGRDHPVRRCGGCDGRRAPGTARSTGSRLARPGPPPRSCRRGVARWRSTTSTSARRTPAHDWPDDFVAELLDVVYRRPCRRRSVPSARHGPRPGLGGRRRRGPTVAGSAPTSAGGSPAGARRGLTAESGTLPTLGPWRRATGSSVS